MEERMKKPIYKKFWFWAAIIVVLIIIGASSSGGDKTAGPASTKTPDGSQSPLQEPKPSEKPAEAKNKPTMTKAEFDQLKNGMSYKEAVDIIGSEGELISEIGSEGDDLHTVAYMWKGEGSLGANANLMFQGGKMESKAQMGLK